MTYYTGDTVGSSRTVVNELPDCMASDPKDNNFHSQQLENLILYRHGIIIFHVTVINIHLT
jgi:hypothetical protein